MPFELIFAEDGEKKGVGPLYANTASISEQQCTVRSVRFAPGAFHK